MNKKIIIIFIIGMFLISSFNVFAINIKNNKNSDKDQINKGANNNELKYNMGLILDNNVIEPTLNYDDSINPPKSWDWRDAEYNGVRGDWTTSIKNQGDCESCYAFGQIALIESAYNIANSNPNLDKDLSEQYIVSCGELYSDSIYGCDAGNSEEAMKFTKKFGAILEENFLYEAKEVNCGDKESGWKDFKVNVRGFGSIGSNKNKVKNALIQYGPIQSGMYVYEDFFDYPDSSQWNNEIYYHKYGKGLGYHSVTIVGYQDPTDERQGYWICKNSWGEGWGINNPYDPNNNGGWFKIAYDNCQFPSWQSTFYVSHLGNNALTLGRCYSKVTGDYKFKGDYGLWMSDEGDGDDGKCSATYEFDIGEEAYNRLTDSLKIKLYYKEDSLLKTGPNLRVYDWTKEDYTDAATFENIGGPGEPSWVTRKINKNVNNYISSDGIIKIRIDDNEWDETILYKVKICYTVLDDLGEPEVDLTTDTLDFGKVSPGGSSTKSLTINNNGASDTELSFKAFIDWRQGMDVSFNPSKKTIENSCDIDIKLTAQDQRNTENEGMVIIQNEDDITDYKRVSINIDTGQGTYKDIIRLSNIIIFKNFLNLFFK